MTNRQTKQMWFFLTQEDELAMAARLVGRLPAAKFIDEWHWESVDAPPVRDSVLDCDRMIGIWASHIAKSVTGVVRQNGKIDGPDIDAIIQWRRCQRTGHILKFGRWAAVYDSSDKALAEFVQLLWRVMEESTTNRLVRTSGNFASEDRSERRFRVGEDVYTMASRGEISLVADQLTLTPEAIGHG